MAQDTNAAYYETELASLLDLTPPVPGSEAEPDEVLELAEAMMKQREPHIKKLQAAGKLPGHKTPKIEEQFSELTLRDAEWNAAVARAQHVIGQRLRACRRLQQARRR